MDIELNEGSADSKVRTGYFRPPPTKRQCQPDDAIEIQISLSEIVINHEWMKSYQKEETATEQIVLTVTKDDSFANLNINSGR